MSRFPALLLAMLTAATAFAQRPVGLPWATRSEVLGTSGMAATSHPLATQVALDVLKAGGSAADAAIAANAALALMEPTGCGLGGDAFVLYWNARDKRLEALNASGRAPAAMTIGTVTAQGRREIPRDGPLPVTVPGAVDGWFALHARHGRLPMAQLLAPAIRYAREGFPMAEVIAFYWARGTALHGHRPNFRETFTLEGRAPRAGEIFRNPGLAATLEEIATRGRDGFYRGRVAETMVAFLREQGSPITLDDLAGNRPDWVEPVSTSYRGYDVWAFPMPTQGIATLQILNLMEGFEVGFEVGQLRWGSPEHLHLFLEAKKLAFEDRGRLYGDPAFADVPVARLISKAYAAERRKLINPARAAREVPAGDPRAGAGDTIYLTVADKDGNFASLIQSNYRGFGSGMVPPGLGFMLQNRGEQFSLDPAHPNALRGGRRPFHTIIPGFVTKDGQPWLSFGVMGGSYQPVGQAWIIMNMVDFGMGLQEAADAPRAEHEGSTEPIGVQAAVMKDGGRVLLEAGFPVETVRDLELRFGHTVDAGAPNFGGFQGIRFDAKTGVFRGASESRKDGQAAGW